VLTVACVGHRHYYVTTLSKLLTLFAFISSVIRVVMFFDWELPEALWS